MNDMTCISTIYDSGIFIFKYSSFKVTFHWHAIKMQQAKNAYKTFKEKPLQSGLSE